MKEVDCHYCGKTIRNGRWIGTLHLCVTPEERSLKDYEWRLARWQMAQQQKVIEFGVNLYLPGLRPNPSEKRAR